MHYLMLLAGILVGFIFACAWSTRNHVGTLRIDRSDPDDQAYMFLELTEHPEVVSRKKYVMLKVSNENYISQK